MPGLDINQFPGLPAAKIFSALLVSMLIKSPDNIVGNAGIKRVIGAKNDINLPIHSVTRPSRK